VQVEVQSNSGNHHLLNWLLLLGAGFLIYQQMKKGGGKGTNFFNQNATKATKD